MSVLVVRALHLGAYDRAPDLLETAICQGPTRVTVRGTSVTGSFHEPLKFLACA